MEVGVLGAINGKLDELREIDLSGLDCILLTGDIGKCDIARDLASLHVRGSKKIPTQREISAAYKETFDSTVEVVKYLASQATVVVIYGNVENTPHLPGEKKEFHIVTQLNHRLKDISPSIIIANNSYRKISGMKILSVSYFKDASTIKRLTPNLDREEILEAQKQTIAVRMRLNNSRKLVRADILLCHQQPYRILDTVNSSYNPDWNGMHAGSELILGYIREAAPRFVFGSHILEGAGEAVLGETKIYNLGLLGLKRLTL